MKDNELIERLRSVPLFGGLTTKALRDVLARSRTVEHADGQLIEEGTHGVGFHLILEGTAAILQHGEVIGKIGRDDYFGEVSLIDGKERSATVRADGPLTTLSVAAWNFAPLLDAHPEMARELLLGLCRHLRAAESRLA